ncbi:4-hydroxy-3-methylbut-2-enyl diphosphate reductase [Qaidamihabitans albus]|uniref:4-hydroxy-3-methylbut-2-enyl diphosphate reductase n=1 Tax=Qaidamihabitans albus TaxID=2795733 RepID=UPI0018F22920|nr:4-hydroxy-3-methylbut-2-enyl diphosphate reductase [Qaidamihabitans albus]
MSASSKRVLLAAPRGFCAGVDRAVNVVREALARYGPPVYVRHQIVHNTQVITELTAAGAIFTDDLDEIPHGARVVFSAHGVSPAVSQHAHRRGLRVIDATCPLVSKVHTEARRFARDDQQVVLIGHPDHIEIEGTRGHAPEHTHVVDPDDPDAVDRLELDPDRGVVWLSQTTLAVDDVAGAVQRLRERVPALHDPPSDDICYASTNRQQAVTTIAPRCELVLVIGSDNSSNSRRLVEVALHAGAPAAHLLDRAAQLRPEWLDAVTTVGVTAGASAPEVLVEDLLAVLATHGFATVELVTTAEENIRFGLPASLRPASGQRGNPT